MTGLQRFPDEEGIETKMTVWGGTPHPADRHLQRFPDEEGIETLLRPGDIVLRRRPTAFP